MSLLPSGFVDSLTPDAAREAYARETLMRFYAGFGYMRVAPPMLEFEETLLSGPGAALNRSTFRVMDPVSHRMLGLRTDHTLQIGRLAATRLAAMPRPLRLSYAGTVVRAVASDRDPARQKTQMGMECIGSLEADCDAEIILLGMQGLHALGVDAIAIDLLLPTLVANLLDDAGITGDKRSHLRRALDRKDEADVKQILAGHALLDVLVALVRASGPLASAMQALANIALPESSKPDIARLQKVVARLGAYAETMTLDLIESRQFEYQSGLSFSFFSKTGQVELGRGGRYRTQNNEPATGLTFYADALMHVMPVAPAKPRIMLPFGVAGQVVSERQGQGYECIFALGADAIATQAKAQQCAGYWQDGKVVLFN